MAFPIDMSGPSLAPDRQLHSRPPHAYALGLVGLSPYLQDMAHLLLPVVTPDRRHPNFVSIVSRRKWRSARLLLQDAFARMPQRDGGFIPDFQSTEFDPRVFELFVSELLQEAGATLTAQGEQPDFEPTINGVAFAVECATVNPTKPDGIAKPTAYRAVNPKDRVLDSIKDRALNEVPTRFGGALLEKGRRRFGKAKVPYWELPNVAGRSFILAMQTFHEDGALGFSATGLATYLYGIQHIPAWDEDGGLIIRQVKAAPHVKPNGSPIPSGYFDDPANAGIAAVLWSNTGTAPKFARMALQGPYPDDEVAAFRVGSAADPDPNAHAPRAFIYEVGDPDWPETWGEGCTLFHNPNATHRLPRNLLRNVINAEIDEEGRYVETIPAGVQVFNSTTFIGIGESIKSAADRATELFEMTSKVLGQSRETRGSTWWDGIQGEGEIGQYRSDSVATPDREE